MSGIRCPMCDYDIHDCTCEDRLGKAAAPQPPADKPIVLPPLPKPAGQYLSGEYTATYGSITNKDAFSEYQMNDYGRACREAALEEAAKAVYDAGGDNTDYHMEAIRALKEKK